MDLVLNFCDRHILTPYVYPQSWPEDSITRQFLTLYFITAVGGWLLYFSMAALSYIFLFDKRYKKHPNYLPNQVLLEIAYASKSIPFMAIFAVPIFVLEVRGYGRLYMDLDNPNANFLGMSNWGFIALSVVSFLMFTDCLIYWIHRWLHHRLVYKYIHKPHHKWKVPTPFASHAFHPIDGFLQSLPYHIYPFIFPLHKVVYLILFVFVNVWTVSIHDGDYRVPDLVKPFINGAAHHTDHHVFYKYNYGQFFTLWDRIGGSFRTPSAFEGNALLKEIDAQSSMTDGKSKSL